MNNRYFSSSSNLRVENVSNVKKSMYENDKMERTLESQNLHF
jgi:hypothetical protein